MIFEEVTGVRPVANLSVDFRNIQNLDKVTLCFQANPAIQLCDGAEGPDTLNGRGRKFQHRHRLSDLNQDETKTYQAAITCLKKDLPLEKMGQTYLSLTCTLQNSDLSTDLARMEIDIKDLGKSLHLVASEVFPKKNNKGIKHALLVLQDKPGGQIIQASNEDLLTQDQRASLRISQLPSLGSIY